MICIQNRTGRGSGGSVRPRWPIASLVLALPLLLSACGGDESTSPSSTPPAAMETVIPTAPPPETGSPTIDGVAPQTLGDLADQVDIAWAEAGAFRSEFVVAGPAPVSPTASPVAGSPTASPVAASERFELRREVAAPNRQRLEQLENGALVSEAIIADGRVFVRGAAAKVLLAEAEPDDWVQGDLEEVAPLAGSDPLLTRIVAPIESPLAAVPDNLRPQELRSLGAETVAGRTCEAYGAADTTRTGARVDITIAVDADNLPCFVETRSGGVGGRETFDAFGEPLTIDPPAQAQPASPPANPATPAGRD